MNLFLALMAEVRDEALLVRRIAFSETSLVIHILTAGHGRLSLMAKGARRSKSPFRSALEPLTMLQLVWRPARVGMGTLTSAERGRLLVPEGHASCGLDLISVASSLFKEEAGDGFDELRQAFCMFSRRPQDTGLLAAVWLLLRRTGWVGTLDSCWSCGCKTNDLFWSNARLCCASCGHGISLSPGLIRGILGHLKNPGILLPTHDKGAWLMMIQDVLRMHGLNRLLMV